MNPLLSLFRQHRVGQIADIVHINIGASAVMGLMTDQDFEEMSYHERFEMLNRDYPEDA